MKILSKQDVLPKFFWSLKVGEIFGFSQAFKRDWVIDRAAGLGIRVTPPAKTTPEYKQYGDYVLKVRTVYPVLTPVRLNFSEVSYHAEIAKRPRKCNETPHIIPIGSACMVETVPDVLPDGKRITRKANYCMPCARIKLQRISNKVNTFLTHLAGCTC